MKERPNLLSLNAFVLSRELEWLSNFLDLRIELHKQKKFDARQLLNMEPPKLDDDVAASPYAQLINGFNMDLPERIVLLLALLPHIKPEMLDVFFTRNDEYGRVFTEFGGIVGNNHNGFMPTGETAIYLLAADNLELRFYLSKLFNKEHFFASQNILYLEHIHKNEPELSGLLTISKEYLSLLTSGEHHRPEYSMDFPAKRISTKLDWDDLVLASETFDSVQEIGIWLQHGHHLLTDPEVGRKIKRGYRSLFYGPSGTGKTLTACLLGKTAGLDVYHIDLSMVVSKYIGETEKNLAKIFDHAENRNWILFFDEADALFGKRTQTSSSNDRYANQEVSYLLQRIEDFPGVVILASNYKSNMDPAFMRRFQSLIRFPMPGENLRHQLYKKAFTGNYTLDEEIDLHEISRKYELSGGNIINVLRYCAMMAIHNNEGYVTEENFYEGIRKELKKTGKTM